MITSTFLDTANDLWWRRIPLAARRMWAMLSAILADGVYLSAWPYAGALVLPLVGIFGFLTGALHWYGGDTFTFSLFAMSLMLAISLFAMGLGAWLWLGYVIGDFFFYLPSDDFWRHASFLDQLIRGRTALLLSYTLLAILLLLIPLISQGLQRGTLAHFKSRRRRLVIAVVVQVLTVAGLVYCWTQATPVLIRPIYTWHKYAPPDQAIVPLQQTGWVLVLVVVAALAMRLFLESRAYRRPAVIQRVRVLRNEIAQVVPAQRWKPPVWLAALLKAAFLTWLLGGILEDGLETIGCLSAIALITWIRDVYIARASSWQRLVARIPLLVRLIFGFLITYLLGRQILETAWQQTRSFQPVLLGTIVSLIVFSLLMPGRVSQSQPKQ